MSVTKTEKGWKVDLRPNGKYGRRLRKTFTTKAEAIAFEKWQISKASQNKDWIQETTNDNRRLLDLVEDWYRLHGATLKDGEKRYSKLKHVTDFYGNPLARLFSADDYLAGRSRRMKGDKAVTANTCNHDLTYLKAVYNTLIKLGNWPHENPLANVEKIKIDESEITYLELNQITGLLEACENEDSDLALISEICLSTGCRWGEASLLRAEQVKGNRITFSRTKNGNARAVPIPNELQARILKNRKSRGQLFSSGFNVSFKAFRLALAAANIELPKGQRTHVLRHSFAVHFMLNRGNILDLQKILGHKTLHITLRYAQFHPDYLQDALTKSPMASIRSGQKVDKVKKISRK